MIKVAQKVDFTGHKLHIGLDSHLKNWDVSIFLDGRYYKCIHQPPEAEKLNKYLKEQFPGAEYQIAYEAGYSGFWIQRQLSRIGLECMVVNASDIPRTDKARKNKNDRMDSRRIAEFLHSGHLTAIYIPDEQTESDRRLVRYRRTNQQDLNRARIRIKSELHLQGIGIPEKYQTWSKQYMVWLKSLDIGQPLWKFTLEEHITQVEQLRAQQLKLNRALRKLLQEDRYREVGQWLLMVPGVGMITAINLLTELSPIERFEKFDNLNSFVGICPTQYSTGDKDKKGPITSRKHKSLREYLIEAAWTAIRSDPGLAHCYGELIKRMSKKRAIIRIAKKLLNRIYTMWKYKRPYQRGLN